MPAPAASDRHADPWLLRQICDELDEMNAAGEDVPEAAFSLAEELADLIDEGVSPRVVAEHAVELARRLEL